MDAAVAKYEVASTRVETGAIRRVVIHEGAAARRGRSQDIAAREPHTTIRLYLSRDGIQNSIVVSLLGQLAGKQTIQRAAETVDVAVIVRPTRIDCLLGRHVVGRAHDPIG